MSCAEVWIEYPLKYFASHEVNTLLGNINKHMQPDRSFEDHYPKVRDRLFCSKNLCDAVKFNPLNANPTKWSNTLKQFVAKLQTNCLSVFDHFLKLALKGLNIVLGQ